MKRKTDRAQPQTNRAQTGDAAVDAARDLDAPARDAAPGRAVEGGHASLARAHERVGWLLLAVGVAAGTLVEALLGFKRSEFLLDPLRRELWSLGHFHAAFLGLVNLAYARAADASPRPRETRVALSRAMRAGSVLLPLGFVLGGLRHPEGDPGFGILLAPVGALLVVAAIVARAVERAD